jgi:uncharacterized Zn finger protein (UPF0148 family)
MGSVSLAVSEEYMTFQFECPQGHLLQGDESQAGQAIPCPVCQMLFLIPAPPAAESPPVANAPFAGQQFAVSDQADASPTPFSMEKGPSEPEILHIPCPKGHELEVPPDMLEMEVLCPQCGEQFLLLASNSVEHKRRREMQERQREERQSKFYLNFAITAAVLVGLLLVTLIIMTAMNTSKVGEKKTEPATKPTAPVDTKPAPPELEEMRPMLETAPPANK